MERIGGAGFLPRFSVQSVVQARSPESKGPTLVHVPSKSTFCALTSHREPFAVSLCAQHARTGLWGYPTRRADSHIYEINMCIYLNQPANVLNISVNILNSMLV